MIIELLYDPTLRRPGAVVLQKLGSRDSGAAVKAVYRWRRRLWLDRVTSNMTCVRHTEEEWAAIADADERYHGE